MNYKELTTFNGTPLETILKNLPNIDKSINKENIEIFTRKATSSSSEMRHKCVLCEEMTSIDDSVSNRGHKLICIRCAYKYFEGDYALVGIWQNKKGRK